jgi:ferritin-like metal-binding protein YciE
MNHPTIPEAEAHQQLRNLVVEQLQLAYALESSCVSMFDSMFSELQGAAALPGVEDLLERMGNNFGEHYQETQQHAERIRERIEAYGAQPLPEDQPPENARALVEAREQNPGHYAANTCLFKHTEIVTYELLERLAERLGDPQTASIARQNREDEQRVAQMIERNWDNITHLTLAGRGIVPDRDAAAVQNDR